ncbi:uncharacterized protein LOC133821546 [Humulus lupulus]|uniref:uncharacterized protein LOC133821546 n=1 Tax=Humulus lupulus TaxID=3486 RepID=UPI002B41788F|nr:uncharacterized protein LOC133821546 [Humulus lupulus]
MEEINLRSMKQRCTHFSTSPSLAIHKDSKTISKVSNINNTKPKIRIIHIFAPEIIKTDVANFRELVQRLTGKPTEKDKCCKKKNRSNSKPRNIIKNIPTTPSSSSSLDNNYDNDDHLADYSKNSYFPTKPTAMKMDHLMKTASSGFQGLDYMAMSDHQRVKLEEEEEEVVDEARHHHHHGMWDMISNINNGENISSSTTGFLEGFLGFEELAGDEFPNLLPSLDNSHVMQFGFGGPQLV